MPVACIRIPHFALRVATRNKPYLDGTPLILSNPQHGRPTVLDATIEATRTGIRAGQNVRVATSLCPAAVVINPDPVSEASAMQEILERFQQLSPLVEPDDRDSGCWYIDLIGLDRHYGTQEHATKTLLRCVSDYFQPLAGVAPTRFAARVAAGTTAPGTIRIIEKQDTIPFLANASVSWLPIEPGVINQLRQFGITTMGPLADMPLAKVTARFGKTGKFAWELANGIDRRQVISPIQIPSVTEELTMPTPAVSREMLLIGLRHLVARAFQRRELRGRYVREVILQAVREREGSWERTLILKEPSDAERLVVALNLRLQALEIPGSIETISLTLRGIMDEAARQQMLPMLNPRNTPSLKAAAHHLKQRYGSSSLYRVVEVEPWSRIPERRHALMRYDP